jgi:hypothetical protein
MSNDMTPLDGMPNDLITQTEAAVRSGLSFGTLRKRVARGDLPRYFIDGHARGRVRYSAADVDRLVRGDRTGAYVERLIQRAPQLTQAQRDKLATVLRQSGDSAAVGRQG